MPVHFLLAPGLAGRGVWQRIGWLLGLIGVGSAGYFVVLVPRRLLREGSL
jgi:hypothetical protein